MKIAAESAAKLGEWHNACRGEVNLSELELTLGKLPKAIIAAKQSIEYADRTTRTFERSSSRSTLANALHQSGSLDQALSVYNEAEAIEKALTSFPLLCSVDGFHYCDLLLSAVERSVWRFICGSDQESTCQIAGHKATLESVESRVIKVSEWSASQNASILSMALDHLTLGRIALYRAILDKSGSQSAKANLNHAVIDFRRAGTLHRIPTALLTRGWFRFFSNDLIGTQADLDEAWEIAERGAMKLFLADTHLHRARLFFREKFYPWKSPQEDLAAAEKLINECGYHRRDEELADAKKAILKELK